MREPQIIVARLAPAGTEAILYPVSFEDAARTWREHQRLMEPGGYVVWINDGDVWRRSGLLDDYPAAYRIRVRVWGEGPSPDELAQPRG